MGTAVDGPNVPVLSKYPGFISAGPPDGYLPWALADGTEVLAPAYSGTVQVGRMPPIPAVVVMLGVEPPVGRGVSDHFSIVLDHGQRLVVEP
jgi:hypothetical protein